ncbi:hypothetical protein [Ferruginibacter sp. HRS2-29]|uniref:hypothetical protein n=1 Tax=Ferruginibacter sp. HRS2-29 TaxID=2487334 RepID=UPI0020CBBC41|nr:hypothetical protein [Ferruginibacter sp. HRS2-29]MCP9752901.1 hypothetical protein [Ferruginibacter sp. HRS2-29]
MKKYLFILAISLFSSSAFSQTAIPIDSIASYMGKKVTICSKVFGSKYFENSKRQPTFLNVGAAYPGNPLTVVVFGEDRKNFPEAPEKMYHQKEICVTGELIEYKGKPEIIVNSPEQIVIK